MLDCSAEVVFLNICFFVDFVHDLIVFCFGLGSQINKFLVGFDGQTLVANLNAVLVSFQPEEGIGLAVVAFQELWIDLDDYVTVLNNMAIVF